MIYIDTDLCTGCGICLPACNRGALRLNGNAVVVDESLCSSCGRCLEVCLTGAIISMEVVPQPPSLALAQSPEAQPFWAGAPSLLSNQDAVTSPAVPRPAASSKLDLVEKVFSGLFAIATYALDRNRGRASWSAATAQKLGNATTPTGGGGGRCPIGQQGRGAKHGQGLGRGRGGGRSLRISGPAGGRRRINRRHRAT